MSERADYDREAGWSTLADRIQGFLGAGETVGAMYSEVSPQFLRLMIAAMMVSFHKYGALRDAYPERVNAIDSLKKRLDKYRTTGNTEYLIDVANFAMIEFMHPAHAKAHFQPTDASGSPGRVATNKDIYDKPNQFKNTDLEPAAD